MQLASMQYSSARAKMVVTNMNDTNIQASAAFKGPPPDEEAGPYGSGYLEHPFVDDCADFVNINITWWQADMKSAVGAVASIYLKSNLTSTAGASVNEAHWAEGTVQTCPCMLCN